LERGYFLTINDSKQIAGHHDIDLHAALYKEVALRQKHWFVVPLRVQITVYVDNFVAGKQDLTSATSLVGIENDAWGALGSDNYCWHTLVEEFFMIHVVRDRVRISDERRLILVYLCCDTLMDICGQSWSSHELKGLYWTHLSLLFKV